MDQGVTWASRTLPGSVTDLAMSSDGQTMLAVFSVGGSNRAYVSQNGGVSWTTTGTWSYSSRCAISSNGLIQLIYDTGDMEVMCSTDGGATWPSAYFIQGVVFLYSVPGPSPRFYLMTVSGWLTSTDGFTWGGGGNFPQPADAFNQICGSSDGRYILIASPDISYVSTDYGANWTAVKDAEYTRDVAMSANGQYMVVSNGNWFCFSSNYGASWTLTQSVPDLYISCRMSDDGQYMTRLTKSGANQAQVSVSSNYGSSWTDTALISGPNPNDDVRVRLSSHRGICQFVVNFSSTGWLESLAGIGLVTETEVASDTFALVQPWLVTSVDGGSAVDSLTRSPDERVISDTLTYVSDELQVGRNTRLGTNWQSSPHTLPVASIGMTACSSTGQYQAIAGITTGYIYVSSNYGATWTECSTVGSRAWSALCMSYDGQRITATVNGGYIYVSTDAGSTWSEKTLPGSRTWCAVSMSSTGQYQTAVTNVDASNNLYKSSDYGATWTARSPTGQATVCVSPNGQYQFATALRLVGRAGFVYSTDYGVNWSGGSIGLSRAQYLACSQDGQIVAIGSSVNSTADGAGTLWISTNGGASFAVPLFFNSFLTTSNGGVSTRCRGVAMSRDGGKIVYIAVNPDGLTCTVYISESKGEFWRIGGQLPSIPRGTFNLSYGQDLEYLMIDDGA